MLTGLKHTKMRILILCLLVCCLSCNNSNPETAEKENEESEHEMAFNATKWKTMDGVDYPFRDRMITDLMRSKILKKLKRKEVIVLLGQPNRTDKEYLFYTVAQERIQFFPLHTKTLVIKLSNDSTTNKVMIHE
jgi:uncharacterized membrane-anchored protein